MYLIQESLGFDKRKVKEINLDWNLNRKLSILMSISIKMMFFLPGLIYPFEKRRNPNFFLKGWGQRKEDDKSDDDDDDATLEYRKPCCWGWEWIKIKGIRGRTFSSSSRSGLFKFISCKGRRGKLLWPALHTYHSLLRYPYLVMNKTLIEKPSSLLAPTKLLSDVRLLKCAISLGILFSLFLFEMCVTNLPI